MIAAEVSLAFNGVNERKSWNARPHASDGRETVHFIAPANLITLVLECETKRFQVRFNKVHAAWGDYVHAIARSLHVVLSTLQTAGQPFEAPEDVEGIQIVVTVGANATYVAWPGEDAPASVEPPKPLHLGKMADMLAQSPSGEARMRADHDTLLALGAVWDGMDGYDLTGVKELDPVEEATMPEIRDEPIKPPVDADGYENGN